MHRACHILHADHAVHGNTFKSAARKSFCYASHLGQVSARVQADPKLPATIAIYGVAILS